MIHSDLSEEVIGAAMMVLNELKPGLEEKIYENALVVELQAKIFAIEQQRSFDAKYKGHQSGVCIQREPCRSNDRLLGDYRDESRIIDQLQECEAGVEARCAMSFEPRISGM